MKFEIEERGDRFTVIHCHADPTGVEGAELLSILQAQIARLSTTPTLRVVVNLSDKHQLDATTFTRLCELGQALVEMQKKLYFVNVPEPTATTLSGPGMEFVHVLVGFATKKDEKKEDPRLLAETGLVDSLSLAVESAFKVLCPALSVEHRKAFVKSEETLPDDLAAQLGLHSKTFDGVVALTFPEPVYLKLVGTMHETSYQNLIEASEDGAEELLNIVRSLSRKGLFEKGYVFDKSIPETVKGKVMEKLLGHHDCTIVVPFECEHGSFYCQVGITQRKRPA